MRGTARSRAIAAAVSGTLCSRPAFMRPAGIVQRPASRSTSDQTAPRTSPLRAAISVRNSRARAAIPSRSRSAANQRATSSRERAGWLSAFASLPGLGSTASRLPFHLAGLSPARCPATVAQESTASIRPRTREAVSVFSCQIGCSTRSTSASATSETRIGPRMGPAYVSSVERHCALCFSLRNSVSFEARKLSTASLKVGTACAARRALIGSPPSCAIRRFSSARSRARASETRGGLPRPSSRRLPRMTIRCTHCRAPLGCTRRNSPCPSKCFPGPALFTSAAVRAFSGRRRDPVATIGTPPPCYPPLMENYGGNWSTNLAVYGNKITGLSVARGSRRTVFRRTSSPPSRHAIDLPADARIVPDASRSAERRQAR